MLKGIPAVISPDLMRVLMLMGHGDELVLADGHFPAATHAQRLIRADGHGVLTMLEAILKFLALDTFVQSPAIVMQPVDISEMEPPIWQDFRGLIEAAESRTFPLEIVERTAFYERAKTAFAIVATSESAIYGNLILKKGNVVPYTHLGEI